MLNNLFNSVFASETQSTLSVGLFLLCILVALICGGIGGGAQAALTQAGIRFYGGVSGDADAAVLALLAGKLGYDPDVRCTHHDEAHGEGSHTCGSHGCGNHSCH